MRLWLVPIVLVLCACATPNAAAPRVHPAAATRLATRVSLEVHADVRFTPDERDGINMAAHEWEHFTNGFARVCVVYDADLRDIERQAKHDLLLRVESTTPYVEWAPIRALAYTVRDPTNKTAAQKVFVVIDRITTSETFRHVMLHEIGHLLWVEHPPPGARAVMAEEVNGYACPRREDMQLFCAFHKCRLEDVRWCE